MKVIAVTSGKGGVGKTSIAASLAVAMQSAGARVLVIDADLGLADMNLAFGVTPTHSLLDVAEGRVQVVDALIEVAGGVKLLPAYAGSFDLANLDERHRLALMQSIDSLPEIFDVIIVDTGAGIGATAMSFAAAATDTIVVSTREPTSIADAYAAIKVLSQRFGLSRVHLLVNSVETAADADSVHATIAHMVRRFLRVKVEPLGYVCRDAAVSSAWRNGSPLFLSVPESPASHCVRAVASRLMRSADAPMHGGVQLFWQRLSAAQGAMS
jgi:flagellar biosynthesis protein FlhG